IGLDAPHLTELKTHQSLHDSLAAMPAPLIIALDEKGEHLTSRVFANKIQNWTTSGKSHLCFLIGGADGLPDTIKRDATTSISLSAMTLPHMLARVFLYEQLWRALSIITHHPYHRD
ncbi:MAG: 23S rRNA (pseudouridine(1915)-N(3))-methyltransferase RlmH, partial [Alphaproteobacteria bacterium]|nr:23S rRNA (pseudouridine(1915)-N(3))-methyltransferase RlmH [Alphaproteobacteria bacterium]